jgi:hypothetical protein
MSTSDESFDYAARAELFPGRNLRGRSRALKYMCFDRAVDAIRFAVEQLPSDVLLSAYLEVDEKRYDGRGIRHLYDRPEYPVRRLAKVA